jgi:hypothetical protein
MKISLDRNLQICKLADFQIQRMRNFMLVICDLFSANCKQYISIFHHRSYSFKLAFCISHLSFIICLLSLSSCFSVKYSMSGASISPEVKTLSISYFTDRSNSGQSMLSQQFTDNLREKCKRQTNLKIIQDGGDVNFDSEITGWVNSPTAIQGNDQAAKNRLTVTIHVKFTNSADTKLSYDSNFSRYQDYSSSKLLDDVLSEILPQLIDDLTEDIFNKAFVNW